MGTNGNAFVTGYTLSKKFPGIGMQKLNQDTNIVAADAFVTKLDANGAILSSTLLGGNGNDYGFGIALDSAGNPYVTGTESSTTNFPSTASFPTNLPTLSRTTSKAFLTKLTNSVSNPDTYSTDYSIVFGGKGINEGIGVAVDSANSAYVVGVTTAIKDFPTNNIPDAARGKNAGGRDVFVTKFDSSGTNLLYSFYLGGSRNDLAQGIDVMNGAAYVIGQTFSSKFPQTNAAPRKLMGRSDAFITIISPASQ